MTRAKKWMAVMAGVSLIGLASLLLAGWPQSRVPEVLGSLDPKDVLEIKNVVSQARWKRLRTAVSKFDILAVWERVPVIFSRISRLEAKPFEGQQAIDVSVELTNRWQKGVTWVGTAMRGSNGWYAVGWGKVNAELSDAVIPAMTRAMSQGRPVARGH
jgi:hypothetical protein